MEQVTKVPKIDARCCIVAWQFVSMNVPGLDFQWLLDFSMYFIGPTIPNGHKKMSKKNQGTYFSN